MTGASPVAASDDHEMDTTVFQPGGITSDDEDGIVFKSSRRTDSDLAQPKAYRYVRDHSDIIFISNSYICYSAR